MQHALGAKNELAFLNDTIPISYQLDLNIGVLDRCNHLIHYWLFNFVPEWIAQTIIFHEPFMRGRILRKDLLRLL